MEKIDLSILKKIPELNTKVILEIEPLAPLSMVSELPGSYYKTLKVPNKKMLCGLLENLLGWHIDLADRKAIVKELSKLREKQAKKDTSIKFEDKTKGSNYCPLLMDYFEINEVQPMFAKAVFYDDLWNKAFRRSDATGNQPTHAKGTINIDYSLIPIKRELPRDQKNPNQIENAALGKLYGDNKDKFPFYYSSPTNREYISIDGKYIIRVNIDMLLFEQLRNCTSTDNICYLGNSEGWIDIKIKML